MALTPKQWRANQRAVETTNKLDQLVELLSELASGTEYHEDSVMRFILKDSTTVVVWQSCNDGGFKWSRGI